MAIAFVQSFAEIVVSNGASGNATATVTGGNFLVCMSNNSNGPGNTVSDGTNTWTQDKVHKTNDQGVTISSALNIAGGSTTVTVSYGGSIGYFSALVQEFSGVKTSAALEDTGGAGDDTTSDPNCATAAAPIDTAGAALLVLTAKGDRTSTLSGPTGWTGTGGTGDTRITGTDAYYAYKIASSAVSGERGNYSSTAWHYDGAIAAYTEAADSTGHPAIRRFGGVEYGRMGMRGMH